jgi:LPPG:FO 2-phospho-L-lactate transferase
MVHARLAPNKGRIAALAGGVGAAKFLHGLALCVGQQRLDVVVNTADDEKFYGLHVCPDLDTVVYTLGGAANPRTGWGLANDSFATLGALARFYGRPWFALGDRDFATHLFRSNRLRSGVALSAVTDEIARRFAIKARVMPMSDDPVRTFVTVRGRAPMPFQEYLVRNRARGRVEHVEFRGLKRARALPAAVAAINSAAAVIVAPSNPIVSIGPILGLRPIKAALACARLRAAAISPIIGGRPVKGPLDKMLRGLGHEVSALGVARLYRGLVSVFVIDHADQHHAAAIAKLGFKPIVTDTIMTTPRRAAGLARTVLSALGIEPWRAFRTDDFD